VQVTTKIHAVERGVGETIEAWIPRESRAPSGGQFVQAISRGEQMGTTQRVGVVTRVARQDLEMHLDPARPLRQ